MFRYLCPRCSSRSVTRLFRNLLLYVLRTLFDLVEYYLYLLRKYRCPRLNMTRKFTKERSPPCGTCSRAREIRRQDVVGGGPPVLRSEAFPLGIPAVDKLHPQLYPRLMAANKVYASIAALLEVVKSRGIAWCVENPRNSLLWFVPAFQDLCRHAFIVDFQACMFGSPRPKWTRLVHGPTNFLSALHRVCDGAHVHAPWGAQQEAPGPQPWRPCIRQLFAKPSQTKSLSSCISSHSHRCHCCAASRAIYQQKHATTVSPQESSLEARRRDV